jgi:hypothetical protein
MISSLLTETTRRKVKSASAVIARMTATTAAKMAAVVAPDVASSLLFALFI